MLQRPSMVVSSRLRLQITQRHCQYQNINFKVVPQTHKSIIIRCKSVKVPPKSSWPSEHPEKKQLRKLKNAMSGKKDKTTNGGGSEGGSSSKNEGTGVCIVRTHLSGEFLEQQQYSRQWSRQRRRRRHRTYAW